LNSGQLKGDFSHFRPGDACKGKHLLLKLFLKEYCLWKKDYKESMVFE